MTEKEKNKFLNYISTAEGFIDLMDLKDKKQDRIPKGLKTALVEIYNFWEKYPEACTWPESHGFTEKIYQVQIEDYALNPNEITKRMVWSKYLRGLES